MSWGLWCEKEKRGLCLCLCLRMEGKGVSCSNGCPLCFDAVEMGDWRKGACGFSMLNVVLWGCAKVRC